MERLSRPIAELRDHYTVVVVGSGYGGGIAASRLSRAGQSVCVLERGREIHPGEYPNSLLTGAKEIQARTPDAHHGSPTGMFDFHVSPDISVLVGCGLGGTSLINANVALEAGHTIFEDERWPEPLRTPAGQTPILKPYYERAAGMLGSTKYPKDWPTLPKLEALKDSAKALGTHAKRTPINVTFHTGPNTAGVEQRACVLCGDCVSGCNYSAKNTVLMNYLPDANRNGAHIFTEVAVRSVHRREGEWVVEIAVQGEGRERFEGPTQFVTADVVVLAAGTLGSTEILLRSKAAGLPLSNHVGYGFSGNGDVLGFSYDGDESVRAVGLGRRPPSASSLVGPTITGWIDLRNKDLPTPLIIEDGSMPAALAAVFPAGMFTAAEIWGRERPGPEDPLFRRLREAATIPLGSYRGAPDRTLTYLVMSTDDSGGRIILDGDGTSVQWPEVSEQLPFQTDNEALQAAAGELGGTFVPDPLWALSIGRSLITVHPLGGCVMADDAARGVVDHKGRVFAGKSGDDVHDGLYVGDGSVIPMALDVNPLLTISAVAERTCELLAADRGWTIDFTSPGGPPPPPPPTAPTLRFTEKMAGFLSTKVREGWEKGEYQGIDDGSSIEFVLTIEYDDLRALLIDPAKPGRITGTVVAPELSPHRLTVTDGSFVLLKPEPTHVETWRMRYEMSLLTEDGRRFRFEGFKVIRKRGSRHAWSDTTTMYTTIKDEHGNPLGVGIMRIAPADFLRQLRTMQVRGVDSGAERRRYLLAFLELFGGSLLKIYGGPLDEASRFPKTPTGPPHIREPHAEKTTWWCGAGGVWHENDDPGKDAWLRLTRFEGGTKGPLLLAPGFGMSAYSFMPSTIKTNLVEFLTGHEYDVWLFDYRASIDLESAKTPFTIDEIARDDWPAAVGKVRKVTDRKDVQALGHCVGSVSLQMAILAGMQGVRSAVCSQFPMHPTTSVFKKLESELQVGRILASLTKTVSPERRFDLPEVALDISLRALPMASEERCGQAVCRWINAIYGCTHRHAQLNEETHLALNELFGVGNMESLQHLALMMRKGRAVTSRGGDEYFDHPDRLAIPILFLQGWHNYIFKPRGTLRTIRWLQRHNDRDGKRGLYTRKVLPGYAHLDSLIGRRAEADVFPLILEHLKANP